MKSCCLLIVLLFVSAGFGFAQDLNGQWKGPFKSNGPSGTFEFVFSGDASSIAADVTLQFNGKQAKGKIHDAKREGAKLTFASDVADSDARFALTTASSRMLGTFEVYEKGRRSVVGAICLAKAGTPPCNDSDIPPLPTVATATQRADDTYDTSVKEPAYRSNGPRILFDEAHNNFHRTTTNYKPFAELIRHDGYAVTANTEPFSLEKLRGYDILVISNARGQGDGSAFSEAEISAVVEWVQHGGAVLLIADHTPFGGYSEKLANRFGVDMSKGYTDDPPHRDPVINDLLFSRENKLLGDHPITNGRNASERINRVVSFTGQSLKNDKANAILKLADTAYDEFPNSDKKIPAAGRSQALAFTHGKGRVFVSGEAAMLTAQISADDRKFGMNVAGIDNRQFALNIMHWLSGLLK